MIGLGMVQSGDICSAVTFDLQLHCLNAQSGDALVVPFSMLQQLRHQNG